MDEATAENDEEVQIKLTRLSKFINEIVGTRDLPMAADENKLGKPSVVMKLDIEGLYHTVWKLQKFFVTQILREIRKGKCRISKSAISTHREALIFDYQRFLHFLKAYFYQINKIHCPKIAIRQFCTPRFHTLKKTQKSLCKVPN